MSPPGCDGSLPRRRRGRSRSGRCRSAFLLDQQGGPNHVANYCEAPIICDLENNSYTKKLSYHYIGHFSRYIQAGARLIGFSRYTDKIEVTAVKNPDGSLVVVLLNKGKEDQKAFLRLNGEIAEIEIDGESISTVVIG